MNKKISPLAPKVFPSLPALKGVRLGVAEAGIKYKNRTDLAAILFDAPAAIAGVFTNSKCPSAPVDWCRAKLQDGAGRKSGATVRAIVVNSGNANAFTGKKGVLAVTQSAEAAAEVFGIKKSEVMLASTGVIGEPLEEGKFLPALKKLHSQTGGDAGNWQKAAQAIMTTDTYPKLASVQFIVDGKTYSINGIAKGSGMIAPDMATMLCFLVTDYPVAAPILQKLLKRSINTSFNAITVDGDCSTSDMVLLASALNGKPPETNPRSKGVKALSKALDEVLHQMAMLVVRDGEGATKHVEVNVSGAMSNRSAKKIALAIANSPLVKTAISGEDANWGRVVMAVGKAGEPADRDRLSIWFGDLRLAHKGERDPAYDETAASRLMREDFIKISVDLEMAKGRAKVWTCDLSHDYIAINADYRS